MTLAERIQARGPKKILALDGGGIRGMMTIEVLAEIEYLLRLQLKKGPEFRLAHYFDFVAGTSTGAIIAACVSSGMTVSEIREFYESSGKEMFDKAFLLKRFRYQYEDEKLAKKLQAVFGRDTRLGSERLQTVLMMVMRNATTDSPWPVSNNPFAKYNQRDRKDCNLNIPLWQLIRASTAAPVYFPPEVVTFAPGTPNEYQFIFVDGGITMYNNPAFQAFIMATTEPYYLNWATGEDKLLIVSVGTGTSPKANADLAPDEMNLVYNATSLPSALMYTALNEQDLLCRVFGKCLAGDPLDREVGNLIGARSAVSPKLFTYVRYNAELTEEGLTNLGLSGIKPEDVQKLDSTDHIEELQQVGQAVAKQKLRAEHFQTFEARHGFVQRVVESPTHTIGMLKKSEEEVRGTPQADRLEYLTLLQKYRDLSEWDRVVELADDAPPTVAEDTDVRNLLALALNRRGKPGDQDRAIALMEQLTKDRGGDSESFGILGRIYKDRYDQAKSRGNSQEAAANLEHALQHYRKGFETNTKDYYTGINIVNLLLQRDDDTARAELQTIVPRLRTVLQEKRKDGWLDFWELATDLQLAALTHDWPGAERAARLATGRPRSGWMLETTLRDLRAVGEKFADPRDRRQLEEILGILQQAGARAEAADD